MKPNSMLDLCIERGGTGYASPTTDAATKQGSLKISQLSSGSQLQASRDELCAIVNIGDRLPPLAITLVQSRRARWKLNQAPGEVCLIGPECRLLLPASTCQLIRYCIPLEALKDFGGCRKFDELAQLRAPLICFDPVLRYLSRVALQLLQSDTSSPPLVADQFTRSFYSHFLQRYGGEVGSGFAHIGGLCPHHKRLVAATLTESPDSVATLEYLAGLCGFSTGHFARAFRQTFGRSFHQYKIHKRTERAEELLENSTLPLREIADRCGYADQATFTVSFARATGTSPGRYRRQYASNKGLRLSGLAQNSPTCSSVIRPLEQFAI